MEEMFVKRHGDFRWWWDTAVCPVALSDLGASSLVDDGESTAGQHEFGTEVVGVDGYGVRVV